MWKKYKRIFQIVHVEYQRNGFFGLLRRLGHCTGIFGFEYIVRPLEKWRVRHCVVRRAPVYGKTARIGFVVPSIREASGGVAIVLHHATHLAARGYDVCIITMDAHRHADWFPITIPIAAIPSGFNRALIENRDVIIATHWSTAFWVERSRAPRRLYFVQSDERRFDYNRAVGASIDETYRMDLEFFTEARWIQRWLFEEYGHCAWYVPNGLDLHIFRKDAQPIAPRGSRPRVLLEGSLQNWFKGMSCAYAAVASEDVEIWIVSPHGAVPDGWRCDRFFRHVPQSEMPRIYAACDFLVKMSVIEGCFGPPLEAMACGCAVIVGEVTGSDEYVRHGENAYVVPQGDCNAARDAIRKLCADHALRTRLIAGGYRTASEWTWTRGVDALENVLSTSACSPVEYDDAYRRYIFAEERDRLRTFRSRWMNRC